MKEKSMIRRNQKFVVERCVCTCDRCGREMTFEEHTSDWQERFAIRFRGGYGSVFGDGNIVEGDFCQQCIHDTLGKYLRITQDGPFDCQYEQDGEPEKIYQSYQLDKKEQTAERLRRIMESALPGDPQPEC
jgi:hypothetical protein